MVDNILILAGGSGTRLWPASLSKYPKQFIQVKGEDSLLKLTVKRALSLKIPGKIYIITLKSQMADVIAECMEFASSDKIAVIPEPEARNTAPALAAAAVCLSVNGEADSSALVLPADHLIEDLDAFKKSVEKADTISRENYLVTFGIKPEYPETGYGYIERGSVLGQGYRVKSFREKPDAETAEKFCAEGTYLWNSGMFCFKTDNFFKELEKYSPDITDKFLQIKDTGKYKDSSGIDILMDTPQVRELYKRSPSISVDYAVMEKSSCTAVVEADFDWNDIGSWDQFETIVKNLGKTDLFEINAENNAVFSDIPVALCDVDNIIVVIKNGKALICRKGSSQKVRDIRKLIENMDKKELL